LSGIVGYPDMDQKTAFEEIAPTQQETDWLWQSPPPQPPDSFQTAVSPPSTVLTTDTKFEAS